MTCPHCGNSDIRRSQSSHWSDGLHRALGRNAYRCRKCRQRFFLPSFKQIATHTRKQSERSRKAARRLDFRKRKRLIRRLITIAVFIVMFSLFGLFLQHLTVDHPPAQHADDSGSSSE
jgi:hypothetical protein